MSITDIIYLVSAIAAVLGPTIALFLFLSGVLQRLAKVEEYIDPKAGESIARLETKVDYMLKWIAALNGDMKDKKEFHEFLTKLKEVAKDKGL